MKKNILLIVLSLILVSCSNDDSDDVSGISFDKNKFETNLQLWKAAKISNYTFSQVYSSASIGSQPKLTSIVLNNVMDSIVVDGNETIDIAKEEFVYYGTIDAVFLLVDKLVAMYEKELNSGTSNMKGVKIEVQYDDELHYPTEIKCVGYYKEVIYGGEYFEIAFSDFEVKQ